MRLEFVFARLHAGGCERREKKAAGVLQPMSCLSIFLFFLAGCRSQERTLWTHVTLRTMILDHPWTTPRDVSGPDSPCVYLSLTICFSLTSAQLSRQAGPFSVSHFHPPLCASPPFPGSDLERRLQWQIWMATAIPHANFFPDFSLATNFL